MRATAALRVAALAVWFAAGARPGHAAPAWTGVDEKVVEKFAAEAGRPARRPLIDTDRGDLLLFVFLVGGAAGGFVAGYCYRTLFPPKAKAKG